ncbi:hypothetical protein ACFQ7B_20470 [Streptomyces erythrochromogenes]|uniref:hypothetical protein n=1 Tax=Streptomyces erythrochromogenes TaxID=285574 RepID=UPI00367B0D7F
MQPGLVVTSRRARVLAFGADRWAAKKAAAQAALAVAEWDYPLLDEHDVLKTVHGLVDTAVAAAKSASAPTSLTRTTRSSSWS